MKAISVSQLNSYLGRLIQTDPILGNITVKGEVSNLKYHSTGHVFFNLKDDKSNIRCFLSQSNASALHYRLDDGMEITVSGYVSVYERGGYYSINVKIVEVEGEGNLEAAFRALKNKLEKEGLFDSKHKKELPVFPKRIAVVTSPTGAAVRDIIKIITEKNDYVDIIVFPCLVQGESAAEDISSTIDLINDKFSEDMDLIILGRGGGSAEDLWPFNEEIVARSIFKSNIPIISAVGHETDFTISDFVADMRAETPTAAAYSAVPDTFELKETLRKNKSDLLDNLNYFVANYKSKLTLYSEKELLFLLNSKLSDAEKNIAMEKYKLTSQINLFLERTEQLLEKEALSLELSNPKNIIDRGYAAVTDVNGKILSSIKNLKTASIIRIYLSDGNLISTVSEKGSELFGELSNEAGKV